MSANFTSNQVTILVDDLPLIAFDASITENHKRHSEVTKFETENGQTISDHVVVKPFTLSLQVLATDSPLNIVSAGLAAAAAFELQRTNLIINASGAIAAASVAAQALADLFSPSQGTYQQVLALQDGKFPFDVFTTIGLYRNMWIEDIGVPRDNKTGGGLIFNLELVQLLLVTPINVDTAIFANANLAAGQTEKGPLAARAPDATGSFNSSFSSTISALPTPPP